MKILWDENTFGITGRSLKKLRDELAGRIGNQVAIVEIQTSDITCGYLILDKTKDQATWSGDGFRNDGGGEGSAGYKTAGALFRIFGITPVGWESVNLDLLWENPKRVIGGVIEKVLECGIEFVTLGQATPGYLR